MSIVNSSKVRLPDGTEFTKQLRVLKDGLFRIKLPEQVSAYIGLKEIVAETADKANRLFRDKLDEFKDATSTEEKVILYQVASNARIMGPDPRGVFEGPDAICTHSSSDVSFAEGITLSIWADVYMEKATTMANGETRYRYTPVEGDGNGLPCSIMNCGSSSPAPYPGERAENRLPWTPERELFFANICRAMESLIVELSELTASPKKIATWIKAGRMLPAPKLEDKA